MTRSRLDRRKPSSFNLFLFYSITFIYLEFLFKIFTTGNIQIKDILLIVIFSISFATIFYILTNILKNKGSYMVSIIFTGITTFLFASQLIYYKIFKVFYTIYSAGNASQVFEFWREIVTAISQNILSMVLISPLIILFWKEEILPPKGVQDKVSTCPTSMHFDNPYPWSRNNPYVWQGSQHYLRPLLPYKFSIAIY